MKGKSRRQEEGDMRVGEEKREEGDERGDAKEE